MPKVLKEYYADEFESFDPDRSCSCHINPPCSQCTHEGNPENLLEDDEAWEEVDDISERITYEEVQGSAR